MYVPSLVGLPQIFMEQEIDFNLRLSFLFASVELDLHALQCIVLCYRSFTYRKNSSITARSYPVFFFQIHKLFNINIR